MNWRTLAYALFRGADDPAEDAAEDAVAAEPDPWLAEMAERCRRPERLGVFAAGKASHHRRIIGDD